MAAVRYADTGGMNTVSPELALVDAELASRARVLLPYPSDVLRMRRNHEVAGGDNPPGEEAAASFSAGRDEPHESSTSRPNGTKWPLPFSLADDGHFVGEDASRAARERLFACALEAEPRSHSHFRRITTLTPTATAAIATTLLVLQLYLTQGSLG
jgi:hypothetical protein